MPLEVVPEISNPNGCAFSLRGPQNGWFPVGFDATNRVDSSKKTAGFPSKGVLPKTDTPKPFKAASGSVAQILTSVAHVDAHLAELAMWLGKDWSARVFLRVGTFFFSSFFLSFFFFWGGGVVLKRSRKDIHHFGVSLARAILFKLGEPFRMGFRGFTWRGPPVFEKHSFLSVSARLKPRSPGHKPWTCSHAGLWRGKAGSRSTPEWKSPPLHFHIFPL